jgi:Kef-type K+ transport system membrane component KefB
LVIVVAFASKLGACYGAARLVGGSTAEALAIGSLMNARGLVELVVLTIGLERGLITPTLFSIMFVMAMLSTLCAPWILRALRGALPTPAN